MSDCYSVGSGTGHPSSKVRCGAKPCPNFTTRPSPLEPWTAHGCCSKDTLCSKDSNCSVCESWATTTWVGFDLWMQRHKHRSARDAANRARKAQAKARERSPSPAPSHSSDCGRPHTRRVRTSAKSDSARATPDADSVRSTATVRSTAEDGSMRTTATLTAQDESEVRVTADNTVRVTAGSVVQATAATTGTSATKTRMSNAETGTQRTRSPRKTVASTASTSEKDLGLSKKKAAKACSTSSKERGGGLTSWCS